MANAHSRRANSMDGGGKRRTRVLSELTAKMSPDPQPNDVLPGWKFVRHGKVIRGDKFWNYLTGKWCDVMDRQTFLGDNIDDRPWIKVIRKDETKTKQEK